MSRGRGHCYLKKGSPQLPTCWPVHHGVLVQLSGVLHDFNLGRAFLDDYDDNVGIMMFNIELQLQKAVERICKYARPWELTDFLRMGFCL